MKSAVAWTLLAMGSVACAAASAPIAPPVEPEPSGSPAVSPDADADVSAQPDEHAPDSPDASPEASVAPPPNLLGIDPAVVDALDKESIFQGRVMVPFDAPFRKLDPNGAYGSCASARLGSADGYFCEVSPPFMEKTGHSVFYMAGVTVRGARLVELFRFPYQARALDFPEAIYATLRAEYDEATGTLTLTDGAFPCDSATTSTDDSLEFQRVVNRLCAVRGRHHFTGSALKRQSPAPKLTWKGPKRKSAFGP